MIASAIAQLLARFFQARRVGFRVREVQRIVRRERGVVLDPARIEQQFQALRRAQSEMVLALRADAPVGVQIFLPDRRAAVFALGPQAFGLHAALVGRRGLVDSFFFSLKPSHVTKLPAGIATVLSGSNFVPVPTHQVPDRT
jgi:hypothetical protein